MKFLTHNDLPVNIDGTCLQGYIQATRAQLEEVFGSPVEYEPGDKVTTEWDIRFEDGVIASIYDWKRYEDGAPAMDEVESWHIGGHTKYADWMVHDAFRAKFDFVAVARKAA